MLTGLDKFRIGDRMVGGNAPCFIIAEAGSNHNGSLERAFALVDAAADAGADAVKFQSFKAAKLYPRDAGRSDYLNQDRSIFDIIREMEMPDQWVPKLAEHCRSRGIIFLSSPFDEGSADLLNPYVPAFKVASYEMTHIPLVRHVAAKGKPVIISTGTADLSEVAATVEEFYRTGNMELALLQCTAKYPAPLGAVNVRAMLALKEAFGVVTGLSDHSREPLPAPIAAVALGADIIEKHFTLSNKLPGPDHAFAVEPHELKAMVAHIRMAETALGSGVKVSLADEAELRAFARRSIFSLKDIHKGEKMGSGNIGVLRNGKLEPGLPPVMLENVTGKTAARDIPEGKGITLDDLE